MAVVLLSWAAPSAQAVGERKSATYQVIHPHVVLSNIAAIQPKIGQNDTFTEP